ncbi:ABC-F family ATP-binding cassette domain-containing protein [Tissierella creatinophila]|uniref:Putative ABC transporter ATP-binding protein YheS n=1 Tax=Tissierella creatinophila DSM 6911 TaxID=1123403 RepID=A0A1U7M8A0_TISCR|nr:ABC-F family ATP-binding cassette domain-containing protein [Tissierella creatinophila]OLS03480.1 putative ABC transporter ATP-binding protein YheS [Tissierella creatinophila DSM 6911]
MSVLSCRSLEKTYVIDTILEDVNFNLELGDRVGVIGLNGSGKTTLFNILSGNLEKDKGDIFIQKDVRIGYLKQHIKIDSERSIFEDCLEVFEKLIKMEKNLRVLEEKIAINSEDEHSTVLEKDMKEYGDLLEKFISLNGYGYKSDIRGVLIGLGFTEEDFDKNINLLSGGQKSRLSLAKLLLENPDLLLLDEPTNHLDIEAISWLEKFLRDYKGATLIISHDRFFLDNVVNRIFLLENKTIKIYNSNYTKFMDRRKKDLEILKNQYENQQKELKRQEEIVSRFMNYGGARYIKQAQSRQKLLDKIKTLDKPMEEAKTRIKFEPKIKSGRDVLLVKGIKKSFGDFKLLKNIDLEVYRGERVGLIGANGIGKTTLFKIILGELKQDDGEIKIGHKVNFGYFDQEMERLHSQKTIIDEVWDENPKLDYYDIRKILSQFLFVGDDIFKEVKDLSGGEKARLSLLDLMLSNANFLLMDEPTNHLDIDSKEILEDALLDYNGTLFVISHDRYFLNRVCNKILELTPEGVNEYLGNYNYYLEKKNESIVSEEETQEKTKTQIKLDRKKIKQIESEKKFKKKQISSIEESISQKEAKLLEIDEKLCDGEVYEDLEVIVELSQEREVIKNELEELYEEWIIVNEE